MSATGSPVLKNVSALMVSQLLTWGLTLLLTLVMPRYLGPEANGMLVLSASIWSLVMVFVGFGMDTYLVKLVARFPDQLDAALGTSLGLRVIFSLVSLLVLSVVLGRMELSPEMLRVVFVIGLSFFFASLAGAVQAALQGLEIMEYISIASVLSRGLNSLVGIAALLAGFGVVTIAAVMLLASVVLFGVQFYFLRRSRPLRLRFERAQALPILRQSLPYVATALVMVGYGQLNVLLIGSMMSPTEVGWYGAASQLFGTLLFLPVVLATALLPQMARGFSDNTDAPALMLRKSVDLVLLIGMPIGFGLAVIAEPLVALIYGPEFAPTAPVLQVMAVTLIFMYLNILIGQYFTSVDRQNTWTAIICISIVVMGSLTAVLVPWCQERLGNGALGGAISLLISESVMAVTGSLLLRRQLFTWEGLWTFARILIAAEVMGGVVLFLRGAPIVVPVLVGALVYTAMIGILKVVPREDMAVLVSFARSLAGRLRLWRNPAGAGGD